MPALLKRLSPGGLASSLCSRDAFLVCWMGCGRVSDLIGDVLTAWAVVLQLSSSLSQTAVPEAVSGSNCLPQLNHPQVEAGYAAS